MCVYQWVCVCVLLFIHIMYSVTRKELKQSLQNMIEVCHILSQTRTLTHTHTIHTHAHSQIHTRHSCARIHVHTHTYTHAHIYNRATRKTTEDLTRLYSCTHTHTHTLSHCTRTRETRRTTYTRHMHTPV